jgi:hypothetical protein
MPAEGTEAHVTLLVAEFLAGRNRSAVEAGASTASGLDEVVDFLAEAKARYGSYCLGLSDACLAPRLPRNGRGLKGRRRTSLKGRNRGPSWGPARRLQAYGE